MKVIFSHGKESGPWGTKIRRLADVAMAKGCEAESVDYTDTMDPEERASRLSSYISGETGRYALVGSSMGAYVSLVAARVAKAQGLFLMAPAIYVPEFAIDDYVVDHPNVSIVHGWQDEIIPVEHSLRYGKESSCDLHLLSADHRLVGVLDEIELLFARWLDKMRVPSTH